MRPHRSYPPRPVSWGTIHEAPPPVIDRQVEARPADWLFLAVLRPAWAYRLELVLVLLLWAINHWLTARLGAYDAAQVILAAAIVVGLLNWTRDPLACALYRSHVRRRWALACRHADLASRNDRVPWVMRCTLTRAGELLRVRLPAGAQVLDLENAAERIAAFLGVREVRVAREPANARYARVVVVRRDPLVDLAPIPWPLASAAELSLWRPVPVGVDEDGSEVTVSLPERNLLEGGEPGSGKSTIVQLLTAAAALDPSVKLTLLEICGTATPAPPWRPASRPRSLRAPRACDHRGHHGHLLPGVARSGPGGGRQRGPADPRRRGRDRRGLREHAVSIRAPSRRRAGWLRVQSCSSVGVSEGGLEPPRPIRALGPQPPKSRSLWSLPVYCCR
jgi:hypothetical protein